MNIYDGFLTFRQEVFVKEFYKFGNNALINNWIDIVTSRT